MKSSALKPLITNETGRLRGGPRTSLGKQRASRNSLKHGIFARDLVIGEESVEEYEQLLQSLMESLQPVGQVEELLVEKLTVYTWRHRRLLRAEAAEIGVQKLGAVESQADRIRSLQLAKSFWPKDGAIARAFHSHDEASLIYEVAKLKDLRERIAGDGLDWERDRAELEELYGSSEEPTLDHSQSETLERSTAQNMCQRYRRMAAAFEAGDKNVRAAAKRPLWRICVFKLIVWSRSLWPPTSGRPR